MLLENYRGGDFVAFGFWQIVLILFILCVILTGMRISRRGVSKTTRQSTLARRADATEREERHSSNNTHAFTMRWLGIALLIVGVTTLGYILWLIIDRIIIISVAAGLIMLAGIIFILLSTRR
ncbi:MAG: hypothetical protein FWE97_01050 [Dehalococcoidia bacterium]|nr:hypothetical protein [Dehalococcoidia bacterium]